MLQFHSLWYVLWTVSTYVSTMKYRYGGDVEGVRLVKVFVQFGLTSLVFLC